MFVGFGWTVPVGQRHHQVERAQSQNEIEITPTAHLLLVLLVGACCWKGKEKQIRTNSIETFQRLVMRDWGKDHAQLQKCQQE